MMRDVMSKILSLVVDLVLILLSVAIILFFVAVAVGGVVVVINYEAYLTAIGIDYEFAVWRLERLLNGDVSAYTISSLWVLFINPIFLIVISVMSASSLQSIAKDAMKSYIEKTRRKRCLGGRKYISASHGETLLEVLQGIQHEKVEYVATFRLDGTKLDEVTSLQDGRVYAAGAKTPMNHVNVHNHPETDVGFSPNDILNAIYRKASLSFVVAGDTLYCMDLRCMPKHKRRDFATVYAEVMRECPICLSAGLSLSHKNLVRKCYEFNQRVAEKIGYKFFSMQLADFITDYNQYAAEIFSTSISPSSEGLSHGFILMIKIVIAVVKFRVH